VSLGSFVVLHTGTMSHCELGLYLGMVCVRHYSTCQERWKYLDQADKKLHYRENGVLRKIKMFILYQVFIRPFDLTKNSWVGHLGLLSS
jgi:hypothetical protein